MTLQDLASGTKKLLQSTEAFLGKSYNEEREDAGPVPGGIMKKIFEKILVITFDKHSIIANREKNVSAS